MKRGVLFYNGIVEPMRPGRPGRLSANSLAYSDGKISAVGANLENDPELARYQRVNLDGAAVYPGFVDAHTHFCYYALALDQVSLTGVASLSAALKKVKTYASRLSRGEWLSGGGLQVELWAPANWPTAAQLDSVTGERPAALYSHDQHSLWVNSEALRLAGITRHTPDPPGGRIERNPDGSPTGILRENAAFATTLGLIPEPSARRKEELYRRALEIAFSRGVTGIHSFDTGPRLDFLVELSNAGTLGLRVNLYINSSDLDRATRVLGSDPFFGYGDDWFRIAGVKFFADGSLGSKTALLHQPYLKSRASYGVPVHSTQDLASLARRARRLGLPCAVHAIGDRAVTNVITALSKVKPPSGSRHRIEHVQMIRRRDIPALRRLGAVASMQPQQLPGDVDQINNLWGARARNCYLFKTLDAAGVPLAFGSDVPIEPLNPLAGISDAVQRRSASSRRALNSAERIGPLVAVSHFTAGPAYAAGEERYSGALVPGYRADLVILENDLRKIPPARLAQTGVVATILDGECVYSSGALDLA
ncbi:MAG: amidohydrolase [Candidatus Zixiibacteriota bacterium]